jgi:hypothetical protein
MERDRLAPRLLPSRLAQPGHGRTEANRLGDGGEDRKIIATVLDEAHERQTQEVMEIPSEGPERFYRTSRD